MKQGEHVCGGPSSRLRLKSKRRGQEAAAKIGNERATGDHWITSSARASTDGGTASPNVFAVLRLMTGSNFVGCSTGKSAGLAPLRILST